jgi:hypothetical protein
MVRSPLSLKDLEVKLMDLALWRDGSNAMKTIMSENRSDMDGSKASSIGPGAGWIGKQEHGESCLDMQIHMILERSSGSWFLLIDYRTRLKY